MSVRKLPDGRWEARVRVDGRHLKKVSGRKADAVAWEARTLADRDRGTHVDMSNRTTVAEAFAQWAAVRVVRPATAANHRKFLRNHLEPLPLGCRPLVRVRPSEIQAWVADRVQVLDPGTVRNHATLLRAMFADAVLDGLIARNPVLPADRLSLPLADKPKVVPLTVEQVQAWADAAESPRTRAMILTQAMLGLRISELLGLRVSDVDFLRREVHVTEQLSEDAKRRVPLKTANSRRSVPLAPECAEVLAEHLRAYPAGGAGWLFTASSATAMPLRRKQAWQAYRGAAEAAGLPDSASSHDLRHHFASVLLHAGESVHAVAERLGDTPQMVLNVYGHLMPGQEDRTRHAISAAWQAVRTTAALQAR